LSPTTAARDWLTIKGSVRIARAQNDILFDEQNARLIDLFSGNGTVWLGHANPRIVARLTSQLDKIWITGGFETKVHLEAVDAIERFLPSTHKVAALYSTGMEAAEFANRLARVVTGKPGVVGFERSMHGKSLATAFLGWDNNDGVALPQIHRLPFVPTHDEGELLGRLRAALRDHPISAVFVEPFQGSGGGYSASDAFYREVFLLCRQFGALLVFDEILTGFYRTGSPFWFSRLEFIPDVILIGKGMGNGFPVSAVVARRDLRVTAKMLPGSTYADNPLAAAAVVATLDELSQTDIAGRVAAIERAVAGALAPLVRNGLKLRGSGAMWIIELPQQSDAQGVAVELYNRGIFVSYAGRALRLLPASTMTPAHLSAACEIILQTLRDHNAC